MHPSRSDVAGAVGAGALTALIMTVIAAFLVFVPLGIALSIPGCYLKVQWAWWMVIGLPVLLVILGVLTAGLVEGLARLILVLRRPGPLLMIRGILEFVVLWGFYSLLIGAQSYALTTSIIVTLFCDLTEPLLDRALAKQRKGQ